MGRQRGRLLDQRQQGTRRIPATAASAPGPEMDTTDTTGGGIGAVPVTAGHGGTGRVTAAAGHSGDDEAVTAGGERHRRTPELLC